MSEVQSQSLHLPPVLDLMASASLCEQLRAGLLTGEPLTLDGSEVERVSTACLQVLTAAALSARSHGLAFKLRAPSTTLVDALADLGLDQNLFS